MVSTKTCVFLTLCYLTCLFVCPSGMELRKKREASTTVTTESPTAATQTGSSESSSLEQKEGDSTEGTTESAEDEEKSAQSESSEESGEDGGNGRNSYSHDSLMPRYQDTKTAFTFNSPLFNFLQMEEYFRQLERTMQRIFESTIAEAESFPNTISNTTVEEVTIDGQKYQVEKTIVKGGSDNSSSILIKSVSIVPVEQMNDTIVAL